MRSSYISNFVSCQRPTTTTTTTTTSMSDYKAAKEAFVADNPGSSVHHINAISITALVSWLCAHLMPSGRQWLEADRTYRQRTQYTQQRRGGTPPPYWTG
jgi:4-hydroxyphenylpyruvate dioxygenase-like putative hemolysin